MMSFSEDVIFFFCSDVILFKLRTIQQKTVKPTYLCPLGARKLAVGKGHETV